MIGEGLARRRAARYHPIMPRYKVTLEYDGGSFVGWQRQARGLSAQGALEQALARLEPESPLVYGAGRTDAGVHATGQVAHFDLTKEWNPFRLAEALNHHVRPHPIAVMRVEQVADTFHARFDAMERSYLYRILSRRAPAPLLEGRVWRLRAGLDVAAMAEGAALLVGRHDFTTFRAAQCQAKSPVKTLDALSVAQIGDEIHIAARARSFLHNQVRSMVGTLVEVGRARWAPARVTEALRACDRAACGPVAPPYGLYLTAVRYPEPEIST